MCLISSPELGYYRRLRAIPLPPSTEKPVDSRYSRFDFRVWLVPSVLLPITDLIWPADRSSGHYTMVIEL